MNTTLEDSAISMAETVMSVLYDAIDKNAPLVLTLATIASAIVLSYILRQGYLALRYFYRRCLQKAVVYYHRIRKNIYTRSVRGFLMAKWEKGVIADILHDALFEANMSGRITDKQYKKFSKIVGKGLDLPDLLPRKIHRAFIRSYFLGDGKHQPKYKKLAGPVKPIPGGPPEFRPPAVEKLVSHSTFLNKMREKRSA